jgi:L-ascorbate metabolism protein UlaG (beta-lactamase superfamily)
MKYLKEDIAFDPLICRWYASLFLLSPATFALTVKNRFIPILESFAEEPELHRTALKNPGMRGGPFVDFSGDIARVRELLAATKVATKAQLELADALLLTNDLLTKEANGTSLEPLYARLPEKLRGLVELGYDLNNHASVRLIEPLLYADSLYNPAFQSGFLRAMGAEARPFILSTPLIDPAAGILVNAPFSDPLFDDLFNMRRQGLPEPQFDKLRSQLIEQHGADAQRLSSFFTDEAPVCRYSPCPPGTTRIRYFGHASLLIEAGGTSVMTDPAIGYRTGRNVDLFGFSDLPGTIDYLLLTHHHPDHVILETLLQLRCRVKTLVVPKSNGGSLQDPSLKLALRKAGFASVLELDELETLAIPGGAITGLPFLGEHGDLHIKSKLGFHVELGGHRVMCLADSNNLDPALYARIAKLIDPPDAVFIGMECTGAPMSWAYGSFLPRRLRREHDEARRLDGSNFQRAKSIIDQFRPRSVFVYAMGAEPWFSHLTNILYDDHSIPIVESNKLVEYCRAAHLSAERLYGKREISLTNDQVLLT